jgi:hypothetical protein
MFRFRVLDQHVVSEPEFRSRQDELTVFFARRSTGDAADEFELSGGRTLEAVALEAAPGATEFTKIGYGLPLTIMIRHVYTGEHPHKGFFGGDGDVAVVSGVKNYDVFNASTRALNFLVKNQTPNSHLPRPAAFSDGSALVAYSPAIMTDSLTVSLELAIATFPQDFVNSLSSAFTTLAGIPMLLPYSGYLLGAGQVLKLARNVGHALFDGTRFSVTASIDFDVPGAVPAVADFRALTGTSFDPTGYQYQDGIGLVDANGNKYEGDEPYIVLSLDGKQRDNLKTYMPTVATAAVLQRFFQIGEGGQVAIDTVAHAIQLASDFKYREQAITLKAKVAAETDATEKSKLQAQLDAALKNISNDGLKPT